MNDYVLGFLGLGFVGNAAFQTFKKHFHCETFDLFPEKQSVKSVVELSGKSDIIFLALPTPINADGSVHLENIRHSLSQIENGRHIVIKSSVPPGTCVRLQAEFPKINIVFNPEFLREISSVEDFANQSHIILGGRDTSLASAVYQKAFPQTEIHCTDTTSAEMTKFFVNTYLATKVSFCNEIYTICEKLDVSYDVVRDLTLLDSRIGSSHTSVPGTPTEKCISGRGIGGMCFPANVSILIQECLKMDVDCKILKAVQERNNTIDRPEKDWMVPGKTILGAGK